MPIKPKYKELEQKVKKLKEELSDRKTLEEGWLLFMASSTEGFGIYDSNLNLIEVNDASMDMIPKGFKKNDIIGKNMAYFAPFTKRIGQYEKFQEVVKTGIPFSSDDTIIEEDLGEERHFRVKAFKVGEGLGLVAVDITDKKIKERELKKREVELEAKTKDLEEMNSALKILLAKRNEDRVELEQRVVLNINELVMPHVKKLKKGKLSDKQRVQLDVLEENLKEIISPFIHRLSTKDLKLTPSELQVANLIRQGEDTKGIARILCSNPRTIEFHRANLRNKLGLKNKKTNLRTFLLSMD